MEMAIRIETGVVGVKKRKKLCQLFKDLVARGQRCDVCSFKSDIIIMIERQLGKNCLQSNLRANLHIESKLKMWKNHYSILHYMLNKVNLDGMIQENVWRLIAMKHGQLMCNF